MDQRDQNGWHIIHNTSDGNKTVNDVNGNNVSDARDSDEEKKEDDFCKYDEKVSSRDNNDDDDDDDDDDEVDDGYDDDDTDDDDDTEVSGDDFLQEIQNNLALAISLEHSLEKQIEMIDKTLIGRHRNIQSLKEMAKDAQNVKENCTVVKSGSNIAAITGGICLLLSPVTGGGSLAVGGTITSLAAATTIGTSLVELALTKDQINEADRIFQQDKNGTADLERSVNEIERSFADLNL